MTLEEFLNEIANASLEPPGVVKLDTPLDRLAGWDSLAVVGFIAMLDERLSMSVEPSRIARCRSVRDLLALTDGRVSTDR